MNLKERFTKSGWAPEPEKDSQSVLARALSLQLEGKPREALNELDAAILISPNHQEVLAARGHVLCELEDWPEAAKNYSKLVEVSTRNATAYYNLVCALRRPGSI